MGFWEAIVIIVVVSSVGETLAKIVKARAGAQQNAISAGELDEVLRRLEDQAALLSEAQTQIGDQNLQIEELHERVEFAERLLSQARDLPGLQPGPAESDAGGG